MKEPILETEHLILRPLTLNDAEDVFKWASDERVAKYMIYPCHKSIEVTKDWLKSLQASKDGNFEWGFVLKENRQLIGSGGVYYKEDKNAWSFGYNFHYDFWGKGFATEAAKAMIKYAYENEDARDFISEHAVDNPASGRVMEKCGLKFSHYGEYSKFDGSATFKAKFYKMHLD